MTDRTYIIKKLSELGTSLEGFGKDHASQAVIASAVSANPWFSSADIVLAVDAIRNKMLQENALREWLEEYSVVKESKSIGIIMAGNIPLVGFFDLLCVVGSGHKCYIKPSSKDTVLIEYIVNLLKGIAPELSIFQYADKPIDAIIATGSDNTNRYFRSKYGDLPAIFRGSRASVAILTGSESKDQLAGLAGDIFTYSGLGCRNVSRLFVPRGYDMTTLLPVLNSFDRVNPKYINNFRQRRAVLTMQKDQFIEGSFYLLHESDPFPSAISEVTYSRYDNITEITGWLQENDVRIQCVVSSEAVARLISHPRSTGFGCSQMPGLTDYPDAVDVMAFLSVI